MGEVGEGYAYQWEVTAAVVLRLLRGVDADDAMAPALRWLGKIQSYAFDGEGELKDASSTSPNMEGAGREDLDFLSVDGRQLSVQIKKRTGGSWSPSSLSTFTKRATKQNSENHRFVFLTNADPSPKLAGQLASGLPIEWIRFADVSEFVESRPVIGVAREIWRTLEMLGIRDVRNAHASLCHQVMRWSLKGLKLTPDDVRTEVESLLVSPVMGERFVRPMEQVLRERAGLFTDQPFQGPSWDDLASGRVHVRPEVLALIDKHLAENALVVVEGPQASGKSVLAATLAHRAETRDMLPIIWDLAHGEPDRGLGEYVAMATTYARLRGREPLVVVENAHLASGAVLRAIATRPSRTPERTRLVVVTRPDQSFKGLPSVDVGAGLAGRGLQLASWYLQRFHGYTDEQAKRTIAGSRFFGIATDFWALWLSLRGFDPSRGTLPWSTRYTPIVRSLELLTQNPRTLYELLYVAAGLGRYELQTDLRAASRLLSVDFDTVRHVAELGGTAGILDVDMTRATCRFWHASLADLYWDVLRTRRREDIDRVRTKVCL